jgi:hypothetical protein
LIGNLKFKTKIWIWLEHLNWEKKEMQNIKERHSLSHMGRIPLFQPNSRLGDPSHVAQFSPPPPVTAWRGPLAGPPSSTSLGHLRMGPCGQFRLHRIKTEACSTAPTSSESSHLPRRTESPRAGYKYRGHCALGPSHPVGKGWATIAEPRGRWGSAERRRLPPR